MRGVLIEHLLRQPPQGQLRYAGSRRVDGCQMIFRLGFDTGPAQRTHQETENLSIGSDGIYLSTGFDQPDRRPALAENLYTREHRKVGSGPAQTPSDVLTITAKNIGALTIDPERAKVSCNARLDVTSDGPLSITLLGCGGGPRSFG